MSAEPNGTSRHLNVLWVVLLTPAMVSLVSFGAILYYRGESSDLCFLLWALSPVIGLPFSLIALVTNLCVNCSRSIKLACLLCLLWCVHQLQWIRGSALSY